MARERGAIRRLRRGPRRRADRVADRTRRPIPIYNQFVVRVTQRDRVREVLTGHGIGTEVDYPVPFHLQECFKALGYQPGEFPAAESAAASTLALPIYGELTTAQQGLVVQAVADAVSVVS